MSETYSLFELNEYIKRVVALNFAEPIWIIAEISQINFVRGNYYLELIQKKEDKDEIVAQAKASIWFKQANFIGRKLGTWMDDLLQTGREIKCKVQVDFSERYGLNFSIHDLDPAYTIGKAALERAKLIEKVKKEGLHLINRTLELAPVVQSVAIISSPQAAGLKDFMHQMSTNILGYTFRLSLFEASMQGSQLETSITQALQSIRDNADKYNALVIIRGGGSKLDLAGFDSYVLAKQLAHFPFPVITGIGHEIDDTITDLVAHTALKTPTAVANFIIDHNAIFETELLATFQTIKNESYQQLTVASFDIEKRWQKMQQSIHLRVAEAQFLVTQLLERIKSLIKQKLLAESHQLDLLASQIERYNPKSILDQGYSITSVAGRRIDSIKQLAADDILTTLLSDGEVESKIIQKNRS